MKHITAAPQQLFAHQSWRTKHGDLVVGRPGWMSLVHYEATLALNQWVPGAPGLALRRVLYASVPVPSSALVPSSGGMCRPGRLRSVFRRECWIEIAVNDDVP